jgi:hypothetical protein
VRFGIRDPLVSLALLVHLPLFMSMLEPRCPSCNSSSICAMVLFIFLSKGSALRAVNTALSAVVATVSFGSLKVLFCPCPCN